MNALMSTEYGLIMVANNHAGPGREDSPEGKQERSGEGRKGQRRLANSFTKSYISNRTDGGSLPLWLK